MSKEYGFEIDFLPVGNGERSGDAIAIRYGKPENYKVLVYDGGTKETGQKLVDHIKTYYGTSRVDHVVNSHPDGDHAYGLSVILEQLEVGELWMHRPWEYSDVIRNYFHDGRITDSSLAKRLQDKMSAAYKLEQIANEKGIPIYEPFQGNMIGPFIILSPDSNWYIHDLIAEFNKSPEQKQAGAFDSMIKITTEAMEWISEHWNYESLRKDVTTSAENESSVILFGHLYGKGILLTGDAGVRALTHAVKHTESKDFFLPEEINFIQIPHHGSRNNVTSEILDKLLGPQKSEDDGKTTKTAYVSASKGSNKHPRQAVVNAFIRRGAKVIATQGQTKRYSHNMASREGWVSVKPLNFSNKVEV